MTEITVLKTNSLKYISSQKNRLNEIYHYLYKQCRPKTWHKKAVTKLSEHGEISAIRIFVSLNPHGKILVRLFTAGYTDSEE